jgi:hypothetical protein
MNRTLRFSSTRKRRSSLSENGSGTATDQTPLQSFKGRLLQQNERVTDIVPVGIWMFREDFFDARGQLSRPTLGAGGTC